MSKFIDKLNQASQAVSQPIGFGRAQTALSKPKILLIASFAQANAEELANQAAGADAGLLHISNLNSEAKALQKICQVIPDIPWGGWLKDIKTGGINQIVKAGCDFIVFPAANTSLAILQDNDVGRIIEVDPSLNEGLLRAVNELPVNAVLIGNEPDRDYSLTWHHLMLFQRSADLLTKPLLVSIPPNVTGDELKALWEAGVKGVVVEVEVGQPAGKLQELRQTIDKLTFPSTRKRGKVEALLPRITQETDLSTEEEE